MATPAARMMLFNNGKALPLHLLRGRLSGASYTTQFGPAVMSGAELQSQASNLVQFLLRYQSTVVPAFGSTQSAAVNGSVSGVDMIIDRSGGFGEVVGRVEARGKKVVNDDRHDDDLFDSDDDLFDGDDIPWDDDDDNDDDDDSGVSDTDGETE